MQDINDPLSVEIFNSKLDQLIDLSASGLHELSLVTCQLKKGSDSIESAGDKHRSECLGSVGEKG